MSKEIRSQIQEFRATQQEDNLVLEGYIAKFNTPTELFDGYFESIDIRAFDDTLKDKHNIYLLYAHDTSKPLASTRNGTLELTTDSIGLRFKATLNSNLSYMKDVYELIKSGELRGCSFGFDCEEDTVTYNSETDTCNRTLLKVNLYEGSVLINPAYEDTIVTARAKDIKNEEKRKLQEEKEIQELKIDLELLKII